MYKTRTSKMKMVMSKKVKDKAVSFVLLIGFFVILPVFSSSAPGSEYYLWASDSGYWSTLDNWLVYEEGLGWVPASDLPGPEDHATIGTGIAEIISDANPGGVHVEGSDVKLKLIDGSLALSQNLLVDYGGSFEQLGGQASAAQVNLAIFQAGTIKQTDGTNTIQGSLFIGGESAEGSYELSGDSTLWANSEWIGHGGTGTFIQTGGTNTAQEGMGLAFPPGSNGTYELSGNGTLSTGETQIGFYGTATFTQTGGSHNAGFSVFLGQDAGGDGTYNLHDGTLVSTYINIGGAEGTGTFNQSGGELDASGIFVSWGGDGHFIQTGGIVTVNTIFIPGDPPDAPTGVGIYELSNDGIIYVEDWIAIEAGGSFLMDGGAIHAISEDEDLEVEDGGSLIGPGTYNIIVEYMSEEIYGTYGDDSVVVIFERNSLLVGGTFNVEQISPDEFSDCTQENLLESSAFDVTFDGDFVGEFTICIPYDEAEVAALGADEMSLQILHKIGPGSCETLDDVWVDTAENVVCGRADSFGKFAVFAEVTPEDLDIDWISITSYKKHVDGTPISHPWRFETWVDLLDPGDLDHIDVTGPSVSFTMTQNGPNSWGYNSPAGYLSLPDLRTDYPEETYTLEFCNSSDVVLKTIILDYSLLPPEPLNPVNFTYPATNGTTIIDTNPTYTWILDSNDEDALMLLLQDVAADAELYYEVPVSITTTSWSPGPLLPDREYELEVSVLNVKDWEGGPAFPTATADGDEFQYSLMIEYLNTIMFTTELSPAEQVEETLDCIEESLADETLMGEGEGESAEKRPNALTNMLERAATLIDDGLYDEACDQLRAAYKKCDGDPKPPDFVTGEAVEELAAMIQGVMESLGCE